MLREHADPIPVKREKAHTTKLPIQATVHEDSAPRVRRPPERYIPSMKGKKYDVAMTQIADSLKGSKNARAMAQMSVKLMSSGVHRKADIVGMIMAQLSMKAAIKK